MSNGVDEPISGRLFTATLSIPSCRLRRDDLVRIYNAINERQVEYGRTFIPILAILPNESPDAFENRRKRVIDSFHTSVNVTYSNDETVSGSGTEFLRNALLQGNVKIVYFTTVAGPGAVGIREVDLLSKVMLLLDFSKPIELSGNPSTPTLNASSLQISSWTETWFTAIHSRLTQLFKERSTNHDWLHRQFVYDALLITIGIPMALWAPYRLGPWIEQISAPWIIKSAMYVYGFFFTLYIFRALFGYSRWVFPKLEIAEENTAPLRHRLTWGAVVLTLFGNALYDLFKAIA